MEKYPAGLNFVPLLSQHTPPPSGRSQMSYGSRMKDFQSTIWYNGNYEGDISMFKADNIEYNSTTSPFINFDNDLRKSFVLNDEVDVAIDYASSDSDIGGGDNKKKALDLYRTNSQKKSLALTTMEKRYFQKGTSKGSKDKQNRLKYLFQAYIQPIYFMISLRIILTMNIYMEKYPILRHCQKYFQLLGTLSTWLLNVIIYAINRLDHSSMAILRGRTIMRNAARRLLWSMTLAKCGDLLLFTLIMFCIPCLFVIAICGLLLSIYCILKEKIIRAIHFLRYQVFDD